MGKYLEALGLMEMTVGGKDFILRPKQGDNVAFLKIQNKHKKDMGAMASDFVPWLANIINREEGLDKEELAELSMFVEFNFMEFFKEVCIAFRMTTREKWDEAEKDSIKGFQNSLAD